jgi:hypothetical protein
MIIIDYIEIGQLCRLKTDIVDNEWKKVRSYYGQVSDQSEVFEDAIELPWHSFISNLGILADIESLFKVKLSFSSEALQMLEATAKVRKDISSIDKTDQLSEEQIRVKLNAVGFNPDRKLTPQQARNLSKLSRLQFGATFSVPGAGKTTEAISFYLLHRAEGQKLLVICPKNAFPAWEEQFQLCLPSQNIKIKRLTHGILRIENELMANDDDVFLISFQQFNRCSNVIAKYLHRNQTFVFVDESHRMKGGGKTDTGRQIQSISHLPIGKLVMSGTPMPQSVADLLPQYSFLFPTDGNIDIDNVKEKFKKVYVRTTKNELLNPHDFPLRIIRTPIPLNEPQRHLYNLILSEELRQASGITNNAIKLYRQLGKSYIRLLQVVTNPSLLLKSTYAFPDALREAIEFGDSNKLKYTVLKARQLAKEGKKVFDLVRIC